MRDINPELLGDKPFPIKAIGISTPAFEAGIRTLLARYLPEIQFENLVSTVSQKGHYTSYTITIPPAHFDSIKSIYEALNALEEIRFVI